jgi:predicted nuclease of restriction endonuclease-like (RecB) superfamily
MREDDRLTPNLVFRDPYLLDFLGRADRRLNASKAASRQARSTQFEFTQCTE